MASRSAALRDEAHEFAGHAEIEGWPPRSPKSILGPWLDSMPDSTYPALRLLEDKPLAWLRDEVKTPPFSRAARIKVGFLLRRVQQSENLGLPHSRRMPSIGARCHELRVREAEQNWRLVYRVDPDAIVIADVFDKKTQRTPRDVIARCRRRLRAYDDSAHEGENE
jgi:phage-related protein